MPKLPEFITAENDLDGNEPVYIAQGGKTRKTLLSKVKDFIIGTTSMGTTATDVTGAVKEINNKVGIIDVENDGNIATQIEGINTSLNHIANRPFFQAQLNNNITVTSSQNIVFTKVLTDTQGMLDNTDKTKINIKESGKYLVISKIINDSTNEIGNQININGSGGDGIIMKNQYILNVGLYDLNAGDYLNIYIVTNYALSFNILANTKITVIKVG